MKLMFAGDLHGSSYYCEKLLKCYREERAEKLILLGDLLYHGPRNDLPKEYDPKKVIELLNQQKTEIACVRGNCDSEVDQMVLEFPIMADYLLLYVEGITIFVTHGHLFHENQLPPLKKGDILMHGHTHVQALKQLDSIMYMNPGSVSLPKEGNQNSYMIYEAGVFQIKNLDRQPIMEWKHHEVT